MKDRGGSRPDLERCKQQVSCPEHRVGGERLQRDQLRSQPAALPSGLVGRREQQLSYALTSAAVTAEDTAEPGLGENSPAERPRGERLSQKAGEGVARSLRSDEPTGGMVGAGQRLYLSLVLGNVNVTLLSKQAKFAYKDEYEKFKLYLTIILILISFTCRFLLNSRVTDAAFNFLLVWYYCTLTIRESILINNGSRIKGWWVFHHYVSTFLSGVMLTWPDGLMYQKFRNQFLSFSMYQSFVQFLQYYYQSGCLYRLRALGERHTMDLTVEGFQSWMWRGLTFLLPFLFFGHFWQLFNALTLFNLARDPECKEWQVLMCGFPFLLLFLGNFFTTLRVVHQKFHNQLHGSKKE